MEIRWQSLQFDLGVHTSITHQDLTTLPVSSVDGLRCVPRGVPLVRTRERVEYLQYNVKFFSNGVIKLKIMDVSIGATTTGRRPTHQSHPHHSGPVTIPSDLSMHQVSIRTMDEWTYRSRRDRVVCRRSSTAEKARCASTGAA